MLKGVGKLAIDHEISVIGWTDLPDEDGKVVPVWIIRNSWGQQYQQEGYFYLQRGDDQVGIESTPCAWALPKTPFPGGIDNNQFTPGWWKTPGFE